jgi:hypothetical protein
MPKYRVETDQGTFEVETEESPAKAQPDAFEKAVNYHTGNSLIDAPLGVLQGAAKGAASTGVGIGALARKVAGLPPLPADTYKADTETSGFAQGAGKFLEQAAEFAIPGSSVGKALKGAGLATRALGQAATAGAVGAAQSGGDPMATGISAGLGGAGELVPAAISGAKGLLNNKALNTRNLVMPFAKATPTQQAVITEALPTLEKLGVKPTADAHEMQDVLGQHLKDLGSKYDALKASGQGQTPANAQDVLQKLQAKQDALKKGSIVLSGNKGAYQAVGEQIQDVKDLLQQNGKLTFDDLRDLRDSVNPKTNFANEDHDLYRKVGDIYRQGMDDAVPGSKVLNNDYRRMKDLKEIVDLNIARGKANPSGLDHLLNRAASHGVGASVGASIGGAVGGPVGAGVGGLVGGVLGPKVAKTAQQMLQNAIDNGAFQGLSKGSQALASAAARMGDTKTLVRVLSKGAAQETVREGATAQ